MRFLPYQERDGCRFALERRRPRGRPRRGPRGIRRPEPPVRILSAGRPVIAAADDESETARLVREVGCGVVIPPARPDCSRGRSGEAADGDHDLAEMGGRAAYVEREADRLVAMERYRALVREMIRR